MIKAIGKLNGRETFFIGLSFGNLDRFREEPGDTFIKIRGEEVGLPHDIIIFSGETEGKCAELLKAGIGRDTRITITKRQAEGE